MKRILVPIDQTVGLEALIEAVRTKALAEQEGTIVRFFYAPTRFSPDVLTIMLECGGSVDQYWSKLEFRTHAKLDAIAYSFTDGNVRAEFEVSGSRCPFPIWTIYNEAKRWNADRMVVGIHSLTGFKRWLLRMLFDTFVVGNRTPHDSDPGNMNERPQEAEVMAWVQPKAA
jgi:hypothetical protein